MMIGILFATTVWKGLLDWFANSVSAIVGMYILYTSQVQAVGKYSLFLACPIGLYFVTCILLAVLTLGKQAVFLFGYIVHAWIEGKQVKANQEEEVELDDIIAKNLSVTNDHPEPLAKEEAKK